MVTREGFSITTIIAKREANGTVTLGADSQSTKGASKAFGSKLAHINEQFWVGGGGRARYCDIIEFAPVPVIHESDLSSPQFNPKRWLVTEAVPSWIEAVRESEHRHLEKDEYPDGVLLVVIAGRIFEVSGDFSVDEHPEFGGIGSGSDYAVGALAAGKSVEKALEIAASLDPYTGGELVVKKGLK